MWGGSTQDYAGRIDFGADRPVKLFTGRSAPHNPELIRPTFESVFEKHIPDIWTIWTQVLTYNKHINFLISGSVANIICRLVVVVISALIKFSRSVSSRRSKSIVVGSAGRLFCRRRLAALAIYAGFVNIGQGVADIFSRRTYELKEG